jgi:hypothetical protein
VDQYDLIVGLMPPLLRYVTLTLEPEPNAEVSDELFECD